MESTIVQSRKNYFNPVSGSSDTGTMATFKVQKGMCNDLDKMVRRFWWGTKEGSNRVLDLKSWNMICRPKRE